MPAATTAPVLPALTTASTARSAISFQQTAIEQLGFLRSAFGRLFVHADEPLRGNRVQARAMAAALFQKWQEQIRIADKVDFEIRIGFQSSDRTIDIRIGRVIAPKGV